MNIYFYDFFNDYSSVTQQINIHEQIRTNVFSLKKKNNKMNIQGLYSQKRNQAQCKFGPVV